MVVRIENILDHIADYQSSGASVHGAGLQQALWNPASAYGGGKTLTNKMAGFRQSGLCTGARVRIASQPVPNQTIKFKIMRYVSSNIWELVDERSYVSPTAGSNIVLDVTFAEPMRVQFADCQLSTPQ
jgi:hypothetical protein